MKPIYIFGILIIGVAIAILVSTSQDASSYASFSEAFGNEGKSFHVAGKLQKQNGRIVGLNYNPTVDPNYCTFELIDQSGEKKRVIYNHPKPQDIEQSDVVVVVGKAEGQDFVADNIILKCPSKYQENKDPFKEEAKQQTTSL